MSAGELSLDAPRTEDFPICPSANEKLAQSGVDIRRLAFAIGAEAGRETVSKRPSRLSIVFRAAAERGRQRAALPRAKQRNVCSNGRENRDDGESSGDAGPLDFA
jgi:hypothetical protein